MILGLLLVCYSVSRLHRLFWSFERLLRGPGSIENLNLLETLIVQFWERTFRSALLCMLHKWMLPLDLSPAKQFHLETHLLFSFRPWKTTTLWPRRMFKGSWSSVTNRGKVRILQLALVTPLVGCLWSLCDAFGRLTKILEELFYLLTLMSVIWEIASLICIYSSIYFKFLSQNVFNAIHSCKSGGKQWQININSTDT